jgi:hypothetical protein
VQLVGAQAHSAFKLDRTSVTIEHTIRLPKSCTTTLNHTLPALERISAISNNRPEGAKHHVCFSLFLFLLFFFDYLFVYLFSFYLLLYFL